MACQKSNTLIAIGFLTIAVLACSLPGAGAQPSPEPEDIPTSESPTEGAAENTQQPQPAGGPCENPLLPIKVGATWIYNMSGPAPDTFTRTIISVEESGFTDQDTFAAGTVRTGEWNCENGNLIALNPSTSASASVSAAGATTEFTTTSLSGVTLPAVVNNGDTWSQSTTLEGTNLIGGLAVQAKNEFATNCTAGGVEMVTVPAGTFEAVKITCNFDMTITMQMEGVSPAPGYINGTTTSWYAPGVGWVKSIGTGEGSESAIELTSYTIP